MKVYRNDKNPIITPANVIPSMDGFEVIGVFNCGTAQLGNEIILLLRVAERPISESDNFVLSAFFDKKEDSIKTLTFNKKDDCCDFSDSRVIHTASGSYLTSISHLRLARSKDGINFRIDEQPAFPFDSEYEAYGVEDPRITKIDDIFYINYSAVSPFGVNTALVSTKDFKNYIKHGNIFCPDNKDTAIFPERINGKYYALHRPGASSLSRPEIWIAESDNLIYWGNHKQLCGVRAGKWDSNRVGAGAVPFKVKQGWLELYHGATADDVYCMGGLLLDEYCPWIVLSRSKSPILKPETYYERTGFLGNVVFSCGVIRQDNIVKMYYGVADTSIAYAEMEIDEILKSLT